MRRTLATTAAVLLTLALAGCGDDDSGTPAASPDTASAPAATPSAEQKLNLPRAMPGLPRSAPTGPLPSGVEFDACAAVPPDLLTQHFGVQPGAGMPQQASLGDPAAADCYYFSGEVVMVAEATTRADQDLPESGYSYEGLPGAVPVPGADRGWAYVFPGQEGATTIVSGLILVKGDEGLNLSISVSGHPYDDDTLLAFAGDVLKAMG